MMEEYLIQLREEVVEALTYTTQQANSKIVDLKPRIEKLEIQAVGQSCQTDAKGEGDHELKLLHLKSEGFILNSSFLELVLFGSLVLFFVSWSIGPYATQTIAL
jgi:hypothetical protein